MLEPATIGNRQTTADDVFARLHESILNLTLTPGTKLSEVEVARQFEVSRQPVREAFIRLSESHLLQVRPQRATEVKRIDTTSIIEARRMRVAVEAEIVRRLCDRNLSAFSSRIDANLALQLEAIESRQSEQFITLDHEFHDLLALAADWGFASRMLAERRAHADRACKLSPLTSEELQELYNDHTELYRLIRAGDEPGAVEVLRTNLMRIEKVLENARKSHPDYFVQPATAKAAQ